MTGSFFLSLHRKCSIFTFEKANNFFLLTSFCVYINNIVIAAFIFAFEFITEYLVFSAGGNNAHIIRNNGKCRRYHL